MGCCTEHTQHSVQHRLSAQNVRDDGGDVDSGDGGGGGSEDDGDDFVNLLLKIV